MEIVFSTSEVLKSPSSVKCGVPLPVGKYDSSKQLKLNDIEGNYIPCAFEILSKWPDDSIRWLGIRSILPANKSPQQYTIDRCASLIKPRVSPGLIKVLKDELKIRLSSYCIFIDRKRFLVMKGIPCVRVLKGIIGDFNIQSVTTTWKEYTSSANELISCEIKQHGEVNLPTGQKLDISAFITFWYSTNSIKIKINLHNPNANVPDMGKWDLGNENSFYLNKFGILATTIDNAKTKLSVTNFDTGKEINITENFTLVQHSSGGVNWNSPNHVDASNKLPFDVKGATLNTSMEKVISLSRAIPSIKVIKDSETVIIRPDHFWQKFPSLVERSQNMILVAFSSKDYEIELQPGETKSHSFSIFLNEQVTSNTEVQLDCSLVERSMCIPWFNNSNKDSQLQKIINMGINGSNSFLAKREIIDQYGWRNFGELYADHESVKSENNELFISHYNNQYDPLAGFLKEYLCTGNQNWKILADDLLDHLLYIDIYRTEQDKPEYNNGLFWHTDHYVQAYTATHRTYSKHQPVGAYSASTGGGGPSPDHCYSSGLALSSYLCLNEDIKEAVLKMASWMINVYEGDGTIIGKLLQIKNCNYLKIPFTKVSLLGSGNGAARNPFTGKYKCNRGTGNYINILLDAYDLTGDISFLHRAEKVILGTISTSDDPSDGRFQDSERTWSYTIVLQAVLKYMFVIITHQIVSKNFIEIKSSLLVYADYICNFETLSLDDSEKLEFPNDTWTAQDLRKAQILNMASVFFESRETKYQKKAKGLYGMICKKLLTSDEMNQTRVVALILQNYAINFLSFKGDLLNTDVSRFRGLGENINIPKVFARIVRFLRNYSFQKEKQNFILRISRIHSMLVKK